MHAKSLTPSPSPRTLPALPAGFGLVLFCGLIVAALLMGGCGREDLPRFDPLPGDAVVLVVGDSLVAGTGAPRGRGWPEGLAARTGWSVINAGVPGNTSADALDRLPALLDRYRPQAVVIAIGGNDFLRNVTPELTRSNLEAMVRDSQMVTEHVALVAIPAKSLSAALLGSLSDDALYGELAETHGLALVPDAVSDVLSQEALRADRIHANARGYEMIAERVAEALADQGWTDR